MEELFFSALTGSVQIDNIIPYILRMETAEYNLQMTGQTGAAAVAGISGGVGVPALHDPSAPNQPPSVPVILESSQAISLGTMAESTSMGMSHGNGGMVVNSQSNGEVRLVSSGHHTNPSNANIQRGSLLSEAGQVLTLYTDASGHTSQVANS